MNETESVPSSPPHTEEATSATDHVFDTILRNILSGENTPGTRLPAERELSRLLGASRPTVREALRRLTEWCLVEPKRGSGIVVRPQSEWSLDVLPAYVRYARPEPPQPTAAALITDFLALQHSCIVDIVGHVSQRRGMSLTPVREAVRRAWDLHGQPTEFLRADFQVIRTLAEAAGYYPGLWLMNRLASVYLDVIKSLPGASLTPDENYRQIYETILTALEQADADGAKRAMAEYLHRRDSQFLTALEPGPA